MKIKNVKRNMKNEKCLLEYKKKKRGQKRDEETNIKKNRQREKKRK